MKLQPKFFTNPPPVSMFDSGKRWFLPHSHRQFLFRENGGSDSTGFAGFRPWRSGGSDSTVLSPASSPDWSGISSPLVFLCPIDSRSENPCWFLGLIADDWCFLGSVDPWFLIYNGFGLYGGVWSRFFSDSGGRWCRFLVDVRLLRRRRLRAGEVRGLQS